MPRGDEPARSRLVVVRRPLEAPIGAIVAPRLARIASSPLRLMRCALKVALLFAAAVTFSAAAGDVEMDDSVLAWLCGEGYSNEEIAAYFGATPYIVRSTI